MKDFNLFLRPVITEKATAAEKNGKYQFFVRKDATKISIKELFKRLYGIPAVKVNVIRTAKKMKMGKSRNPIAKKPEFKKVIVTTKSKKNIDVAKPKLKS